MEKCFIGLQGHTISEIIIRQAIQRADSSYTCDMNRLIFYREHRAWFLSLALDVHSHLDPKAFMSPQLLFIHAIQYNV
jgi:proteasome lid subunit RPN8/RPN11